MNTIKQIDADKFVHHPWLAAGFVPPFRLVTVLSIPAPPDAGAFQIGAFDSYQAQLNEVFAQAKRLGVELCNCQVCGACLMHNFVMQDSEGTRFVVGSDCATKQGDDEYMDAVQAERKRIEINTRVARKIREAQERTARWKAEDEKREAEERDRNGGYTDAEMREMTRQAAETAKRMEWDRRVQTSKWLGEVGEKIEFAGIVVKKLRFEGHSYSGYGSQTRWLTIVEDDEGTEVAWWNHLDANVGDGVVIHGTVKSHGNDKYTGSRQTTILRAKLLEVIPKAAEKEG